MMEITDIVMPSTVTEIRDIVLPSTLMENVNGNKRYCDAFGFDGKR